MFDDNPIAQNRAQGCLLLIACVMGNTKQPSFFSLGLKIWWVQFSHFDHLNIMLG